MPLYEYECAKCGVRFEKIEKVTAPHKQKCPKCAGRAERLLAAPAFQFKGSGWYATDYAAKGAPPAATESDSGSTSENKETKGAKESKDSAEGKAAKEKKEKKAPRETKK